MMIWRVITAAAVISAVGAEDEGEECCWCGKKYRTDRKLGTDFGEHWVQGRTAAGPDLIDVQPDKTFYVAEVDGNEQPSLFFYVRHIHVLSRKLAVTISIPEVTTRDL